MRPLLTDLVIGSFVSASLLDVVGATSPGTPVLLFRDAGTVYAIHDRCSHRGCSLSDGDVDGHDIVCACHGSRFDLRNGALDRGPATATQPAFQARDRDGVLEIRRLPPPSAS